MGVVPFQWILCSLARCSGQRRRVCGQGDQGVCAKTKPEAESHTPVSSTLDVAAAPVGCTKHGDVSLNFKVWLTHSNFSGITWGNNYSGQINIVCVSMYCSAVYLSMRVARVLSTLFRKALNVGFVSLHWHTHSKYDNSHPCKPELHCLSVFSLMHILHFVWMAFSIEKAVFLFW